MNITRQSNHTSRDDHASALLGEIQSHDLSRNSDEELLAMLGKLILTIEQDHALTVIFAIVVETARRRLGAWQIFSESPSPSFIDQYRPTIDEIVDRTRGLEMLTDFSYESFINNASIRNIVNSFLVDITLSNQEKTVVLTMAFVAIKTTHTQSSKIMLHAAFYNAISSLDQNNDLGFNINREQLSAMLMLHRGVIVEMPSGEGKTITIALAAIIHALSGRHVHIFTSNDYLAARDVEWISPIYDFLNIRVSTILSQMGDEERKNGYNSSILYGTVREFGFDFLRDNLKLSRSDLVQRTLDVVIVDEADQSLIDEAGTPLIISNPNRSIIFGIRQANITIKQLIAKQFTVIQELIKGLHAPGLEKNVHLKLLTELSIADPENAELKHQLSSNDTLRKHVNAEIASQETINKLQSVLYYIIDTHQKSVILTELGHSLVEKSLGNLYEASGLEELLNQTNEFSGTRSHDERPQDDDAIKRRISRKGRRANQIYQLLQAHLLLHKDTDYIVNDNTLILLDPVTGRQRVDSKFQDGLQTALEAKEFLPVHPDPEIKAKITVQGYVSLYRHLSGITATAITASDEFRLFYRLAVKTIAPANLTVRTDHMTKVLRDKKNKIDTVLDEIFHWHLIGRPVLVVAGDITESREISERLKEHKIRHELLNATTSESETEIIRNAGCLDAITVATNMAGRGSDIQLESNLNHKITSRCIDAVNNIFNTGVTEVILRCSTSQEAEVLANAFEAANIDISGPPSAKQVIAKSKLTPNSSISPTLFEFGLGLHVIGTDSSGSTRTDAQLRGRVARQGAFGSTSFILSLEDRALFINRSQTTLRSPEINTGLNGINYSEGPRTQLNIDRSQQISDSEDASQRFSLWQLNQILEKQTLEYYAFRKNVLESKNKLGVYIELGCQAVGRLVDQHICNSAIANYGRQFAELSKELRRYYSIDIDDLFGSGPDRLKSAVNERMGESIFHLSTQISLTEFDRLGKLLRVQAADELWSIYLAQTSEIMQNMNLWGHSHKRVIAEYTLVVAHEYQQFLLMASDGFVIRLFEYLVGNSQKQYKLNEDLKKSLS